MPWHQLIVVSNADGADRRRAGGERGLVVPLVAVHMFVFYFGLMVNVTPPVGLTAFATSAISAATT